MRVCLAGNDHSWRAVQARKNQDGRSLRQLVGQLVAGHPYRLVSYLDAQQLPDPKSQLRALVDEPGQLVMDSGLFSFMFGAKKGELAATYEAYRDHVRRYLDDLAAWDMPCIVVEADAQRILGVDATKRLREEFAPLGSRVMYVWHMPEGLEGLVELAKERDYIAIGLPELRMLASGGRSVSGSSTESEKLCNDLLRRVHTACGDSPPRIHLLGCTVESMMQTRLAWSCDSTSWLSGIRFGNGVIWTEKGLQSAGIRSPRFRRFRDIATVEHPAAVAYAAQQVNPDYYLDCIACAHAYALYQQWLDVRYSPVPMRGAALPEGPHATAVPSTNRRNGVGSEHRRNRSKRVEPERPERVDVRQGAGVDPQARVRRPRDGSQRT